MAAPDRCSDVRPDRAGYPQCRQRGATDSGNTCAADNADTADSDSCRHAGAHRSGAARHTAGRSGCAEGQAADCQAEDRHHHRRGCGRRDRRACYRLCGAECHGVQPPVCRRPLRGGAVQRRLRGGEQHRRPAARSGPAPAADEPGRTDRERNHHQRPSHRYHRQRGRLQARERDLHHRRRTGERHLHHGTVRLAVPDLPRLDRHHAAAEGDHGLHRCRYTGIDHQRH